MRLERNFEGKDSSCWRRKLDDRNKRRLKQKEDKKTKFKHNLDEMAPAAPARFQIVTVRKSHSMLLSLGIEYEPLCLIHSLRIKHIRKWLLSRPNRECRPRNWVALAQEPEPQLRFALLGIVSFEYSSKL
jgi:hypothetical protein